MSRVKGSSALRIVDDFQDENSKEVRKKIQATFLMPCLNEEKSVGIVVQEAKRVLGGSSEIEWQILVADNGSTDRSIEIARAAGAEVIQVREKGYGAALHAGILSSRGQYIVFCDADSTYDPGDAPKLLEKAIETQADLVLGSRLKGKIDRGAMPWMHRWVGTPFLSFLIRRFFQLEISDCNSGIRCVKKERYLKVRQVPAGMEFASAQLVQAAREGWKVAEVGAHLRVGPQGRIPHLKRWRDGMRHLLVILAAAPGFFWGVGNLALWTSLILVIPSFWGTIQITENVGIFGPHTQAIGTVIGFYGATCLNLALLLFARYSSGNSIPMPRLAHYFLNLPEGILFWGLVGLSSTIGVGVGALIWFWVRSQLGALNQLNFALGLIYFAVVPLTLGVGVFQAHLQKRVKEQ